jgi:hypothetical protein
VKSAILRAAITDAEKRRLRVDAARRGIPIQEHVAQLLRAGKAALDGKGRK